MRVSDPFYHAFQHLNNLLGTWHSRVPPYFWFPLVSREVREMGGISWFLFVTMCHLIAAIFDPKNSL